MKIYTRKGDDGTTGLWYGGRVAKYAGRPEAYGSVDEAASALGLARVAADRRGEFTPTSSGSRTSCSSQAPSWRPRRRPPGGSRRACRRSRRTWSSGSSRTSTATWTGSSLPPKFAIPGGTELSARLDVARAAVRRAERRVAELKAGGDLADDIVLTYLNRLSDAVFAMARFADEPDPELFEGRR